MIWRLNFITITISVSNSVIEFQAEERIKYIFMEVKTLNDRERHPALEMPTSRMAHGDRERHNVSAK
jgi:hypothetical protein